MENLDSTKWFKLVKKNIYLIITNQIPKRDLKVRFYELERDDDFPLLFTFNKKSDYVLDHFSMFRKYSAINFLFNVYDMTF